MNSLEVNARPPYPHVFVTGAVNGDTAARIYANDSSMDGIF